MTIDMSKAFSENFWEIEQRNVLFVLMPFHLSLDEKFHAIENVAKKVGFDKAERIDGNLATDLIPAKILDGIANSRVLLFDLSDDPKSSCCKEVNGNVLYELGVGNAIRESTDMLIIRSNSSTSSIPFNIAQLPIHKHEDILDETWLGEKLRNVQENQEWHKSKRVRATAERVDMYPLLANIVDGYYRKIPAGQPDHFNVGLTFDVATQISINRLLDLGILRLGIGNEARELSYNWTPFGRAVMKHLGIEKVQSHLSL